MILTEGVDWKRCEDCHWMIIKDSTDRWTLFLALPRWVDVTAAGVPIARSVPRPDPHKCEITGKDHR
jgi:hypothetical protein